MNITLYHENIPKGPGYYLYREHPSCWVELLEVVEENGVLKAKKPIATFTYSIDLRYTILSELPKGALWSNKIEVTTELKSDYYKKKQESRHQPIVNAPEPEAQKSPTAVDNLSPNPQGKQDTN